MLFLISTHRWIAQIEGAWQLAGPGFELRWPFYEVAPAPCPSVSEEKNFHLVSNLRAQLRLLAILLDQRDACFDLRDDPFVIHLFSF